MDTNGFTDRKEGEMGPIYGSAWRHFNAIYDVKTIYMKENTIPIDEWSVNKYMHNFYTLCLEKGYNPELPDFNIDQLKFVINEIKTNPTSRRILMTSFNPAQVHQGVLWPCHSITIQFYVQDEYLDMFCYNRSSDCFHGIPFNIPSSALLLMIISKITNLTPRYLNLTLGDAHIYSSHIEVVEKQIERMPYFFPKIQLPAFTTLEQFEKLTFTDFKIINYNYHPTIKADMVA